jgi:hypothetical protein
MATLRIEDWNEGDRAPDLWKVMSGAVARAGGTSVVGAGAGGSRGTKGAKKKQILRSAARSNRWSRRAVGKSVH